MVNVRLGGQVPTLGFSGVVGAHDLLTPGAAPTLLGIVSPMDRSAVGPAGPPDVVFAGGVGGPDCLAYVVDTSAAPGGEPTKAGG